MDVTHIKINKGLDLPLTGAPEQRIHSARNVASVAVIGPDFVGMKPTMLIEEGDRVTLGQPLFEDKKNPGVIFAAPGAGVVAAINRGPQRVLQSVVIRLEGDEAETFDSFHSGELARLNPETVRDMLVKSGQWTALRTRPYSKVPAPDAECAAIFVNAIDTNPAAADPAVVIASQAEAFKNGLAVLSRLTDGEIFVCKAPGADIPLPDLERLHVAEFEGMHPAGNVGTHMHFLKPVSARRSNWHIGPQDVIAFGKLFTTGRIWTERVVALGGPLVKNPRLIRTRVGAHIDELLRDEIEDVDARAISGSVWNGRRAAGWAAYLGRYASQITVLAEGRQRFLFGWINPFGERFSVNNVFASALQRGRRRFAFTTTTGGSPRAMVAIGNYEKVMPLDILPTQLLRALLVRDTDSAQELGCMELDEEDVALCSFVCIGKYDFGPVLRANLELIEKEG